MRWGNVPCDGSFRAGRCAACCMQQRGLPRAAAWPLALRTSQEAPAFLPDEIRTLLTYRGLLQTQHQRAMMALTRAERVVAVSGWLYDALLESGVPAAKLRLSRQGIHVDTQADIPAPRRGDTPFRLGYVGRFDPVKGVDILIRAFLRIPRDQAIELHLFGVAKAEEGAAYLASLQDLASRDARIVFRGSLPSRDRHHELSQMHMLAVPSVWFETGPLVVLEAFAAGIPVLGSDLGGIPERVTHAESGWLVPPGDVRKWHSAIEQLLARWKAGKWTWRIPAARRSREVAVEMNDLYAEIADRVGPGTEAVGP